jgi:hypothetical protein
LTVPSFFIHKNCTPFDDIVYTDQCEGAKQGIFPSAGVNSAEATANSFVFLGEAGKNRAARPTDQC